MRKPVLAAMTGLTAVVVGLGIKAGWSPTGSVAAAASPVGVLTTTATPQASTDTSETPAVTATPSPSATSSAKSGTVNGEAAGTRYGPVQVQITVKSGQITAVDAIVYPTQDRRDQEINSWAVPQLDDEVLQAQSGQIDTVSGATVTSYGYITSLQSALDQARSAGLL